MTDPITILVDGEPVPKQSTRFDGKGRAHTDPRVKAWQDTVSLRAIEAMRGRPPIIGPVSVRIVFVLGNRRRVDVDNLNKAVLDSMNGIVFKDDTQVVNAHLVKKVMKNPGALILVYPGEVIPGPFDLAWTISREVNR